MKKTFYTIIIAFITLIASSCSTGCGCPGNAGYGNHGQIIKKTEQLHLA